MSLTALNPKLLTKTKVTNMPRRFFETLVPKVSLKKEAIKPHLLPFLCVVALLMAFYAASRFIAPGWVTYTLSSLCLVLIGITALARVNDITQNQTGTRWQVRRAGLILVGAACLGLVISPWISGFSISDTPTWREVMLRLGIALTWITTPMMPPWHMYITGEHKTLRLEVPANVAVEVTRTETDPNSDSMYSDKK